MIKQFIRLFCFCILCTSFWQSAPVSSRDKNNIIISIQPFSGITTAEREYIFTELKKLYPLGELKENIDLPLLAYNARRKRCRADSLINFLNTRVATAHIIVGLTNKNISTTKDSIADWGVIGLGLFPGNACVASNFRVSKADKGDQIFKLVIHELGHTLGLQHCSVSTCLCTMLKEEIPAPGKMNFVRNVNHTLSQKDGNLIPIINRVLCKFLFAI